MKRHPAIFVVTALSLVATPLALAHPGHEGTHDLIWDFDHLSAHPLATISCILVISAIAWVGWRLVRTQDETARSTRRDR